MQKPFPRTFQSFEELRSFLRNWHQWGGDVGPYDFVGLVVLLGAILDHLRSEETWDLKEVCDFLTAEQLAVLLEVAKTAKDDLGTRPDE